MEAHGGSPPRSERLIFETDRQMVSGEVTLPPVGYQSRFSDWFNRTDVAFIPLVDVEITPHDGGAPIHRPFAVLAKAHVRLAYPLEASPDSR